MSLVGEHTRHESTPSSTCSIIPEHLEAPFSLLLAAIETADLDTVRETLQTWPRLGSLQRKEQTPLGREEVMGEAGPLLGEDTGGMNALQVSVVGLGANDGDDGEGEDEEGEKDEEGDAEDETERKKKQRDIVIYLLDHPSTQHDTRWGDHNTTLHLASFLGQTMVVMALLQRHDVEREAVNGLGLRPSEVAPPDWRLVRVLMGGVVRDGSPGLCGGEVRPWRSGSRKSTTAPTAPTTPTTPTTSTTMRTRTITRRKRITGIDGASDLDDLMHEMDSVVDSLQSKVKGETKPMDGGKETNEVVAVRSKPKKRPSITEVRFERADAGSTSTIEPGRSNTTTETGRDSIAEVRSSRGAAPPVHDAISFGGSGTASEDAGFGSSRKRDPNLGGQWELHPESQDTLKSVEWSMQSYAMLPDSSSSSPTTPDGSGSPAHAQSERCDFLHEQSTIIYNTNDIIPATDMSKTKLTVTGLPEDHDITVRTAHRNALGFDKEAGPCRVAADGCGTVAEGLGNGERNDRVPMNHMAGADRDGSVRDMAVEVVSGPGGGMPSRLRVPNAHVATYHSTTTTTTPTTTTNTTTNPHLTPRDLPLSQHQRESQFRSGASGFETLSHAKLVSNNPWLARDTNTNSRRPPSSCIIKQSPSVTFLAAQTSSTIEKRCLSRPANYTISVASPQTPNRPTWTVDARPGSVRSEYLGVVASTFNVPREAAHVRRPSSLAHSAFRERDGRSFQTPNNLHGHNTLSAESTSPRPVRDVKASAPSLKASPTAAANLVGPTVPLPVQALASKKSSSSSMSRESSRESLQLSLQESSCSSSSHAAFLELLHRQADEGEPSRPVDKDDIPVRRPKNRPSHLQLKSSHFSSKAGGERAPVGVGGQARCRTIGPQDSSSLEEARRSKNTPHPDTAAASAAVVDEQTQDMGTFTGQGESSEPSALPLSILANAKAQSRPSPPTTFSPRPINLKTSQPKSTGPATPPRSRNYKYTGIKPSARQEAPSALPVRQPSDTMWGTASESRMTESSKFGHSTMEPLPSPLTKSPPPTRHQLLPASDTLEAEGFAPFTSTPTQHPTDPASPSRQSLSGTSRSSSQRSRSSDHYSGSSSLPGGRRENEPSPIKDVQLDSGTVVDKDQATMPHSTLPKLDIHVPRVSSATSMEQALSDIQYAESTEQALPTLFTVQEEPEQECLPYGNQRSVNLKRRNMVLRKRSHSAEASSGPRPVSRPLSTHSGFSDSSHHSGASHSPINYDKPASGTRQPRPCSSTPSTPSKREPFPSQASASYGVRSKLSQGPASAGDAQDIVPGRGMREQQHIGPGRPTYGLGTYPDPLDRGAPQSSRPSKPPQRAGYFRPLDPFQEEPPSGRGQASQPGKDDLTGVPRRLRTVSSTNEFVGAVRQWYDTARRRVAKRGSRHRFSIA